MENTIDAGEFEGEKLDVVSALRQGQKIAGAISEEKYQQIIENACPGEGAAAACTLPIPWRL